MMHGQKNIKSSISIRRYNAMEIYTNICIITLTG